jgi:hypothetical protein
MDPTTTRRTGIRGAGIGGAGIRGARARRGGFTLIEAALATVIIGVGVVAIIEAHTAFMRTNTWSSHAATATLLGIEVRELTRGLPRHDPVTGLSLVQGPGGGMEVAGWGPKASEVTVLDFNDVDDFDGAQFGNGGNYPGPIDAFGNVIPHTLADGSLLLDNNGVPLPLQGWSQTVVVEKVHPHDFTMVLPKEHRSLPERDVGDYPLRVTVIVEYQGPYDSAPAEVNRVTWIVP